MAGFQLMAGPDADVTKFWYGESRILYQSPNEQYDFEYFDGRDDAKRPKSA
jgi:hypothetical protein